MSNKFNFHITAVVLSLSWSGFMVSIALARGVDHEINETLACAFIGGSLFWVAISHFVKMCRVCWMTLPSGIRKKHNRIWRELRPFIKRADNSLKYTKEDAAHVLSLIDKHKESMAECMNRANNIRTAKEIEPDNSIEAELKEMGLI